MSEEIKVTEVSLGEIAYGDLKAKFEELGIPQIWKAGTKKEALIKNALEALSKIELEGSSDDESGSDDQDASDESTTDPDSEDSGEDLEEAVPSEKPVLTKEQLKKAINNIDQNLKVGIPQHRAQQLAKREELEKLLSDLD